MRWPGRRRLQPWGAESATPAGTEDLWGKSGGLPGPCGRMGSGAAEDRRVAPKGTQDPPARTASRRGRGDPRWPGGADTARRQGPALRCPAPRPAPAGCSSRKGVGADGPEHTQPCFPAGGPAPGRRLGPVAERRRKCRAKGFTGRAAGVRPRPRVRPPSGFRARWRWAAGAEC